MMFHFTFPPEVLCENHHISRLDLAVLTVDVKLWGHTLEGRRVLVNCDNEASDMMVNSGRCKD